MATPPKGTKEVEGLENYGVDENGDYVFFGFKTNSGPVHLSTNHLALGQAIMYLQTVAKEALQRRIKVSPTAGELEVRETQANFVKQLDFEVDATGQSAALLYTTQDGIRSELQIPFDLIEGLHTHLPGLITEMKNRQQAHKRQH